MAPERLDDTLAIWKGIRQPMAGGGVLFGVAGFAPLTRNQAVQVIMPDVKHCGGLLELTRIAAMADADGVAVAPHNPSGPVSTAATVQACAVLKNFRLLEYQWGEAAWRHELLSPPELFANGGIEVPDRPGFGVELNDPLVRAHPLWREPSSRRDRIQNQPAIGPPWPRPLQGGLNAAAARYLVVPRPSPRRCWRLRHPVDKDERPQRQRGSGAFGSVGAADRTAARHRPASATRGQCPMPRARQRWRERRGGPFAEGGTNNDAAPCSRIPQELARYGSVIAAATSISRTAARAALQGTRATSSSSAPAAEGQPHRVGEAARQRQRVHAGSRQTSRG